MTEYFSEVAEVSLLPLIHEFRDTAGEDHRIYMFQMRDRVRKVKPHYVGWRLRAD